MFNFTVEPSLLLPFVPKGTELDSWDGRVYMSLVCFLFLKTKVWGLSFPGYRNFEEVNLRFYVRRRTGSEVRRGVVFIQEIVPKLAIALIARWAYNENYVRLPMRHEIESDLENPANPKRVAYAWGAADNETQVEVELLGDPRPLSKGSEEEFITEHFWGYARQRDGSAVEYRVRHPSWRTYQISDFSLLGDLACHYPKQFASALTAKPKSVLFAEGSAVSVSKGIKLAN